MTDINGKNIEGVTAGLQDRIPLLAAGNRVLHESALNYLNG